MDVVHYLFYVDGLYICVWGKRDVHALLIAGVFVTAATFETARRKPEYFGGLGRSGGGEHE